MIPVEYVTIPDGDAGTMATLRKMRELARVSAPTPLLQRTGRYIVGSGGAPRGAARIRRFLARHVRFHPDPFMLELVQTPRLQLERIRTAGYVLGDCDDIATLGAALGLAVHLAARFVVLAFDPAGPWEHVYCELLTPDGWAELDTSREMQRVPPDFQPARVATFDV
jgi:transglutaminase-like putative cysteine protease